MPFEVRVELPQPQELLARKEARLGPCGVQHGSSMPLREHEAIVLGVLRIARVVPHLGEEQRGHHVRSGHAARGMAASRLRGREDRVDPKLRRDIPQGVNRWRRHQGYLTVISEVVKW